MVSTEDRKRIEGIIGRSSTTFANATLFFPKTVRSDVRVLYAFVRTADDFVDSVPQDAEGFRRFRRGYSDALRGTLSSDPVVEAFVELSARRRIEPAWVEDFLDAMEQDLTKSEYVTLDETLQYVRGSAEAVGLMMARIMGLCDESLPCARLMGRAFQYINFVRDIAEDLELGRVYLPKEDIAACGLESLDAHDARANPQGFEQFISLQIGRYRGWRREAELGYGFIPRRALAAVKTAADIFDDTASVIERRPAVVFERKVKPSKVRVILAGVLNLLSPANAHNSPVTVPADRAEGETDAP